VERFESRLMGTCVVLCGQDGVVDRDVELSCFGKVGLTGLSLALLLLTTGGLTGLSLALLLLKTGGSSLRRRPMPEEPVVGEMERVGVGTKFEPTLL
jgi:hypothetical protein